MYPHAKRKLQENGIPFTPRAARQITTSDYHHYDHLICMDHSNLRLLQYIIGEDTQDKVPLLMAWAGRDKNVADPWYTGDFEATYHDLIEGCTALLQQL